MRRLVMLWIFSILIFSPEVSAQLLPDIEIIRTLEESDRYIATGQSQKALIALHKGLQQKNTTESDTLLSHLYNNIAIVLARYNNFTAAMSCFHKAGEIEATYNYKKRGKRFISQFSYQVNYGRADTESIINDDILELMIQAHINQPTMKSSEEIESEPIEPFSIVDAFLDNKVASHYAVMILIKQPIAGQKKTNTGLGEVGHAFISLIKYNEDLSAVNKTFGFYPESGLLIPVNPLAPKAKSVIKDDSFHDWDQLLGKMVSKAQFEQMLEYIDHNISNQYHLNKYNCSDFALTLARIAAIDIQETEGTWPLGRGDNPAYMGQSVLGGKFLNLETKSKEGLFTCSNNLFTKRSGK